MSARIATVNDYAAAQFEAWVHEEGEWKPPTSENWAQEIGCVAIRIAWLLMFKSKAELVLICERMFFDDGGNRLKQLTDDFAAARSAVLGFAELIDAADTRLLSAACSSSRIMATQGVS